MFKQLIEKQRKNDSYVIKIKTTLDSSEKKRNE